MCSGLITFSNAPLTPESASLRAIKIRNQEQVLEPEEPLVLVRKFLFISRVRSGGPGVVRANSKSGLHTVSDHLIPVRFHNNSSRNEVCRTYLTIVCWWVFP